MRGRTLGEMLTKLRAEIGQSPDSATGQSETPSLKYLLARTQELLYDEHDWSHLSGQWHDVTLQAGQRYYDFPVAINFERAHRAWYRWGDEWIPLPYGFDPTIYNTFDSDENSRSDPPQRWRIYSATQFEIWPLPATNGGAIRWQGTQMLPPLVSNDDVALLDDLMIVLFAAAEKLSGKELGKSKRALAERRLATMKVRTNKRDSFRIGSGERASREPQEIVVRVAGT